MKTRNGLLEFPEAEDGETKLPHVRANGEIVKCRTARCVYIQNVWSHCVPLKGAYAEGFVANLVTAAALWLGQLDIVSNDGSEPDKNDRA